MSSRFKIKFTVRNTVLFSLLGALLVAGDLAFEALPNIHPVACLIAVYTVVWRKKALVSVYIYAIITAIYSGFTWSIPYFYIWTVLWAMIMVIPKGLPTAAKAVLFPTVCGLHGLMFGLLWAPTQALLLGLNFKATVAWVASGLPFDLVHAVGNVALGLLVLPLSEALDRVNKKYK